MDSYEYKPLESDTTIRLLVLSPSADGNQPLKCHIAHMDRASLWAISEPGLEPSTKFFEAVSYSWGNPDFSEVLTIDNSFSLRITPNVKAMLCSFRHHTKTRLLWIDAICLNQADNDEKAVQISLMGDIYRQAAKVRIWLGENDSTIPHVFAMLQSLAGRASGLSDATINSTIASQDQDTLSYLDTFLKRSWFSRRWIIQEASVSHTRTVHCGQYKISWDWMIDAFEVLSAGWRNRKNPNATTETALLSMITIRKRNPNLLTLLWEFDKSRCFDLHDYVFSMLGLARDVSGVKLNGSVENLADFEGKNLLNTGVVIPVSYNISWTATYTFLTQSFISHGHDKEILEHLLVFGSIHDHDPDLPSWVPSWNQERKFSLPDLLWEPDRPWDRPLLQLPENDREKRIILTNWHKSSPVKRVNDIIEELEVRMAAGEGVELLENRWTGDHQIGSLLLGSIDGGLFSVTDQHKLPPDFWLLYKDSLYSELIDAVKRHGSKWPYQILRLDSGHAALARNAAQPGDLVIYSHERLEYRAENKGNDIVNRTGRLRLEFGLVLRPTEKDPKVYHFVGPCFVMPFSADKKIEESMETSFYAEFFVI